MIGTLAGGAVVYQTLQQPADLPKPVQEILPPGNAGPTQTLTLNTRVIETPITQAVA